MKMFQFFFSTNCSSLMSLAYGRVAVVLEGGYFVPTVAEGMAMSLRYVVTTFYSNFFQSCNDIMNLGRHKTINIFICHYW